MLPLVAQVWGCRAYSQGPLLGLALPCSSTVPPVKVLLLGAGSFELYFASSWAFRFEAHLRILTVSPIPPSPPPHKPAGIPTSLANPHSHMLLPHGHNSSDALDTPCPCEPAAGGRSDRRDPFNSLHPLSTTGAAQQSSSAHGHGPAWGLLGQEGITWCSPRAGPALVVPRGFC